MSNQLYLILAAIAASAPAAPALAQQYDSVSVKVETRGLDLTEPADIDRLNRRISRAASLACDNGDYRGFLAYQEYDACKSMAVALARRDAERAIASARSRGKRGEQLVRR